MNWLNLQMFFFTIGFSVAEIFGPIYLYELGIPVWQILMLVGLHFFVRLPFRPMIRSISCRYGYKPVILVSLLGMAISYLLLMQAQGLDQWFWGYFILYTPFQSWYWLNYHVLYAKIGEAKHRGKDIAMRKVAEMGAGILSPVVNGFMIAFWGFDSSFILGAICLLVSGIFIFLLPQNLKPDNVVFKEIKHKINWRGFNLFVANSFAFYPQILIWQLVLFIMLADTISFGGILGYVVFVQMMLQLFIGKAIDQGKGVKLVDVGFWGDGITTAAKVFLAFKLPVILVLEISQSFSQMLKSSTYSVLFYNDGKESVQPYWYHFLAECGWDVGASLTLFMCGGLHYYGIPLRSLMLLGLIGVGASWAITRRYYGNDQSSE